MGRHKLWFETDGEEQKYLHRSNTYTLIRPNDEGWRLVDVTDGEYVVHTWSTRRKNPPFTDANGIIKGIASGQTPPQGETTETDETEETV